MTNFAFKLGFWNETHTRLWLLKKIYNPQGFVLAQLRRKLIGPGAHGKCPKTSVISVRLMLVTHADSLGFLLNRSLCCINSFGISPFHQASTRLIDPWHHCTILNRENFTWSHTKVWQSIVILQWGVRSIPKSYVFLLCRIIEGFKTKKGGRTLGSVFQLID